MKRSAVLGWSKGVDPDKVAEILIDNPFGNGSEKHQSALSRIIIRRKGEARC